MYKPDRNISYQQKHKIMRKLLKDIDHCQKCNAPRTFDKVGKSKLHVANISGNYLVDPSDWMVLCFVCHWKYDNKAKNFKGKEPWRKK